MVQIYDCILITITVFQNWRRCKAMNPTEAVCSGIKHGKRCSKLIGNDAVFCLDCGPGHNDSLPGTNVWGRYCLFTFKYTNAS